MQPLYVDLYISRNITADNSPLDSNQEHVVSEHKLLNAELLFLKIPIKLFVSALAKFFSAYQKFIIFFDTSICDVNGT